MKKTIGENKDGIKITIWELDGWFSKVIFVIGALHAAYYGIAFTVGFLVGLVGAAVNGL